ncbi:hypothetical protein DP116_27435 [Brasilonema bromeliae SPC951]|uniref:Uncharacterized protein n=1 Tax=Brasilonema bromeliae SPC951 TaxID=385972 RepID=A0ABX1PEP1_9CYAN|nr:hypothetical protein [Brasilonema bromeliae SPC951]
MTEPGRRGEHSDTPDGRPTGAAPENRAERAVPARQPGADTSVTGATVSDRSAGTNRDGPSVGWLDPA